MLRVKVKYDLTLTENKYIWKKSYLQKKVSDTQYQSKRKHLRQGFLASFTPFGTLNPKTLPLPITINLKSQYFINNSA